MATNKEVAEAFVQNKPARSANMTSTCGTLLSYQLVIARWEQDPDGVGMDTIVKAYDKLSGHTNTTQRHMRELEAAMRTVDRG